MAYVIERWMPCECRSWLFDVYRLILNCEKNPESHLLYARLSPAEWESWEVCERAKRFCASTLCICHMEKCVGGKWLRERRL